MGANHSQPKDRNEERKAKRSPTLSTLMGKSPSRLNLLGLGKRSPQPPATPVTPQALTVAELVAEQGTASPEASVADPEDRPEVCFCPLFRTRLIALSAVRSRHKYAPRLPHLLSLRPQSSGPRVRHRDRHAPTTSDSPLPGGFVESPSHLAAPFVDLSRLTLAFRTIRT